MFTDRHDKKSLVQRIGLFIKRFFIVIGVAATVAFALLFSTLNRVASYEPPSLPDSMILTYTFKSGLAEKISNPSLSQPLLRPATTFHEIIGDITEAAKDERVKGFAAQLQNIDMTPAQLQELRDTIALFRKSGKRAAVFAEDFGMGTSGMGAYYLASAFDEIWLQPVGGVAVNGISAEIPFLKTALDKIGVEPQFIHKGLYKSTPESLTETGMTAPHREMMTSLVGDLASQIVTGISSDRKIDFDDMRRIVNNAPYTDKEALQLKLVDKNGYYDQMVEDIQSQLKTGDTPPALIKLQGYSFNSGTANLNLGLTGFASKFFRKSDPAYATKNKAKIALIIGTGNIVSHKSRAEASIARGGMTADKISEAFDAAAKDADVAAIVFRVDSPGGSPAAAETIRRAVTRAQQKGKPVIVSMGGYAASGGYWVSANADKIVAEPATITGSIGVFGGKFVLTPLWEKLGINWEAVTAGEGAGMWSVNRKFSEKERARFNAIMQNTYDAFIERVMLGRKMTREQVLAVAEGRVWTGKQAKEKGLVDELGGLHKAIELAKLAAQLPADQDMPVEQYPPQKSTLELFIQLATEGVAVTPDVKIDVKDLLLHLKSISPEMLETEKIHIY